MEQEAYQQRVRDIEKKWENRHKIYGKWEEDVKQATLAAGLSNFARRNEMPTFHWYRGLSTAMQILEFAPDYETAVQRLTSQVVEPSVPPCFATAVQFVLNDLLAECVQPIDFSTVPAGLYMSESLWWTRREDLPVGLDIVEALHWNPS